MAKIPNKMLTHKRITHMLDAYREDESVFATETEYYLALYAHEMWMRLNALKLWTERYRLNTDSIEAFIKREFDKKKENRIDFNSMKTFWRKKLLALHECELGRREIMDIE